MAAEIVTLETPDAGSLCVLVSQGFNCFSWKAPLQGAQREMLYAPDGFETGKQRPSSGGIPLLFPFPGRIDQGRFSFEGKSYEVPSGDALGNALHGFAFSRPWRVVDRSESHVTGEFQGSVDAPETLDYWPSDYRIRVTYRLLPGKLVTDVYYDNPGDGTLPCGFGTHAYFRLPMTDGADVEAAVLTVPVESEWLMQEMIPTGESEQNEQSAGLPNGLALEGRKYDSGFRLAPTAAEQVKTAIDHTGVKLSQACDDSFGCYVIYTPPHRQAVCIEPYTCVPNPFALEAIGVDSGLQLLTPGECREHTLTLQVEG